MIAALRLLYNTGAGNSNAIACWPAIEGTKQRVPCEFLEKETHLTGVELHRWVDLALNMPGCPNNAVIQQGCYLFAFGTYSTPFLS